MKETRVGVLLIPVQWPVQNLTTFLVCTRLLAMQLEILPRATDETTSLGQHLLIQEQPDLNTDAQSPCIARVCIGFLII